MTGTSVKFLLLLLLSLTYPLCAQNNSASYPQTSQQISPQTRSQAVCPWLTQGSAARALDGDVSVTTNVTDTGEGSCRFSRQQEPANVLEILVSKSGVRSCPADSPRLTGIGNEATLCRLREPHSDSVEMVSSRVRELHFTVTLSLHGLKSSTKSPDSSADELQQIAEQVAGNLY